MIIVCAAMMLMLLSAPERCTQAARQALTVWGLDVVPSLFPYMVLCRLAAGSLMRIHAPAALCSAVLGFIGGSPSGAAALSVYKRSDRISPAAFHALCAFCGCVSPMFLLSTLRNWGFSTAFCLRMLIIHASGAAAAGMLVYAFSVRGKHICPPASAEDSSSGSDVLSQSIRAVLYVGGCIVFFSVAAEWLCMLLPADTGAAHRAMLHAALEMSGGIHRLSRSGLNERTLGILCSAAAGFGGFSILLQNKMALGTQCAGLPRLFFYALLRCFLCSLAAVLLP